MTRVKIAAVSYLNTIPFVYGIRHATHTLHADLLLDTPAGCALNVRDGLAGIGLVPLAAVRTIPQVRPVTDFCIGANGLVRTVILFSNVPLHHIETIYLDPHSRTSVMLARMLARDYWKINPQWRTLADYNRIDYASTRTAYLLIGDKVFGYEGKFKYGFDLAQQWQLFTGLPFVFAVWVSRTGTPQAVIDGLNGALSHGVEHIAEAIREIGSEQPFPTAYSYLTENISFVLDSRKREAMRLFLDRAETMEEIPNPG